jgi:hypothetical protein
MGTCRNEHTENFNHLDIAEEHHFDLGEYLDAETGPVIRWAVSLRLAADTEDDVLQKTLNELPRPSDHDRTSTANLYYKARPGSDIHSLRERAMPFLINDLRKLRRGQVPSNDERNRHAGLEEVKTAVRARIPG